MSKINAQCALLSNGRYIVGVKMTPQGNADAQVFCGHLGTSLMWGIGGHVEIKDKALIFTQRHEGKVGYELSQDQCDQVDAYILNALTRIYWHEKHQHTGFTIVRSDIQDTDQLTEIQLTQI